MTTRIILVDDHKIFHEGISSLFAPYPDMQVVAVAEDGLDALKLVRNHTPDLVILDINMPGLNGIDVTRRICQEYKKTKVLALSMHADRYFVLEMLKAGASGYLLKTADFKELLRAIRTVKANNFYLSPGISQVILEEIRQNPDGKTSAKAAKAAELSQREREVLQLCAEGKTTKQIADILFLSTKTVETHRLRLMKKLEIHSLAELTKYAIRVGLSSL